MALTDKLTAIGDAIRGKTGGTEPLTLDQMATEIANIQGGGGGGTWSTATITTASTSYAYDKKFDISNYVSNDNKNWFLFVSSTENSTSMWQTAFIAPFLSELYYSTKPYGLIYTESRHGGSSENGATKILGYSDGFLSEPENSSKIKYNNGVISWSGDRYYQMSKKAILLYQE